MKWSICIFAHNEERLLPRCLGAIEAAADGGDYVVHVMENGSRDRTAAVARTFAAADRRVHVHECSVGDKANAWNDYVHRLSDDADIHIFIDGDVRPSEHSFTALADSLATEPDAYAAAALPATGRSRRDWATRTFNERFVSGNLYALRGSALDIVRERGIRLPFGIIGEDGLVSYLLLTDLNGGPDDTHSHRITIAADAHFEFDSLGLNLRDLQIYYRRLTRYSLRHFQNQVLYALLKERGVGSMPDSMGDILSPESMAKLAPRRDLESFFIDQMTLKQMRSSDRP